MSQIPVCKSGADLARLDGQRVRVEGVYRKEMSSAKKGGAESCHGQALIELTGRTTDYDLERFDAPATVSLGVAPRPDEEISKLEGQSVTVEGRLVLNPPPADPEAASERLPPTLFDIATISAK